MVILIILTLIILFLYLYSDAIESGIGSVSGIRMSLIKTLIMGALLCHGFAELLSFSNSLNISGLSICWLIALLVVVTISYRQILYSCRFKFIFKNINNRYWLYLILTVLLILLPLFLLSILVPPNNYDSMTYHLSRVAHWIQNQNIYPYQTNNLRQIALTPLAEYVILNFQILSGSDYFANLVQWFSMLGSMAVVSLLVKELGLNYKGQFFSALLALSIPMGVFQSTTTQNDYVASFFFLSFIYFAYISIHKKLQFWNTIFFISCSLSLGGLTKYTTLMFALPFTIWYIFLYFKMFPIKKILIIASIVILIAGIILFPFVRRNQIYFHSALGPESIQSAAVNENLSLINMMSNSTKTIIDNFVLPLNSNNIILLVVVQKIHQVLGISPYSSSTNLSKYEVKFVFHEDYTGSPLHIIFFILAGITLLFNKISNHRTLLIFSICIILAFLLYSFLFKWQPWANRYLLQLGLASTIVSGTVISKMVLQKPFLMDMLIVALLLFTMLPVFFNPSKPLFSVIGLMRQIIKKPKSILLNTDLMEANISGQSRKRVLVFYDSIDGGFKIKPTLSNSEKVGLYRLQDSLQFFNQERRSIFNLSRLQGYFINRPQLYEKYKVLFDSIPIKNRNIALLISNDTYEYPLWVLARLKFGNSFTIGCVNLANQTIPKQNLYPISRYDIMIYESNNELQLQQQICISTGKITLN